MLAIPRLGTVARAGRAPVAASSVADRRSHGGGEGEAEGERRPLAEGAREREVAAEEAGEAAAHAQPEPGAADGAVAALVHLPEGLEDELVVLGGDPEAAVGDRDD